MEAVRLFIGISCDTRFCLHVALHALIIATIATFSRSFLNMQLQTIFISGVAALGLSACVVMETGSTLSNSPSPFPTPSQTGIFNAPTNTGASAPAPATFTPPTLREQLAGSLITGPGTQLVLRPDGRLEGTYASMFSGQVERSTGTWSANGNTFCINAAGAAGSDTCGTARVSGNQLIHEWSSGQPPITYQLRR